ncbi:hypothetical protein CI105_09160 [Candidatus Izimaplasma bacterium ZiA1]|uniref:TolB family protein n=1 Tax=Candidatus Izimoplasma sp. ZiA1 TaxID=2024899 RepID=UPI000BAA5106|nr:hypothetical protein CI105_09160 [Candidatus Izimaplasma bacterium ZiA1]
MNKKYVIIVTIITSMLLVGCTKDKSEFPVLTGDYLGQTTTGTEAELFAPEIISLDNRLEGLVVFSPDKSSLYMQIYNDDFTSTIYYSYIDGEQWTKPVEAIFAEDQNIKLSSISPDGSKLYLSTNIRNQNNILSVSIDNDGFGEPLTLPSPINSDDSDSSFIEMLDGSAYFTSSREGSASKDIWYIENINADTLNIQNMGEVINSSSYDFSPCLSSDGSYMIFGSDRFGRNGLARLYISFHLENEGWSAPINLNSSGAKVNDDMANQSNPTLSPDGEYLFFMRHYDTYTMDIYWVSTDFIEDIRSSLDD